MPSFFSDGNTPRREDPRWRILQKLLGATLAGGGGGGGGGGGPGGAWIIWEDIGPNPSGAPTDPTKVLEVRFRDGFPPVTWDPVLLGYF